MDEYAIRYELGRVAALGEYLGRARPASRGVASELVAACDLLCTAIFGMLPQADAPRCSPAQARAILRAIAPELEVPDSAICTAVARITHAAAHAALQQLCPTGALATRDAVEAVSTTRPTGEG